ncbi:thermonuclease family protein [Roseomonas rosulenta]|uniref:thermonuclease family protein n=1 Tax=Roseomonas rosulenta TaxID=2748667 RepID=UPI0018DFE757|nr:thermonuclease family protein [Roseomonas rosulenta]
MPWWLRWAAALAFAGIAVFIPWQAGLIRPVGQVPRVVYGIPDGTPAPATRFSARVGVVDGDTLSMGADRLRIHGIDAPEAAQSCERGGQPYACGAVARTAMAGILGRGVVSCEQLDTDRYGRRIVRCHDEQGRDIGAELVRQGWALAFTRYATDYVAQEAAARAARRGLWEGRFDAPWDWRARQRD